MSLPNELSLEERREYYKKYPQLCELLGQEAVDEGLMRYSVMSLVEELQLPQTDVDGRPMANPSQKPWCTPYRELGTKRTHYRFIRDGGWEKYTSTVVLSFMVPHQYQHNDMARYIIKPALLKRCPWLAGFKLKVYSMDFYRDSHDEDFYVELGCDYYAKGGFNSLYVPIRAFLRGDVAAIVKRNQTYFKDYCHTDAVWAAMKLDPTVIRFLDLVRENQHD